MLFSFSPATIIACGLLLIAGCQGLPPAQPGLITSGPVLTSPPSSVAVAPSSPVYLPQGVPAFPEPMHAQPGAFANPAANEGDTALAPQFGLPTADASLPALPNPLKVPVANHDYAWDQIADVVSDYFPIAREQRVHIDQQVWTEGRIETPYQVGATLFEPQRRDSVGSFNQWQSTLQTIRRRAVVRVVPEPDGYLLDIQVDRELEDLPRPEQASAGTATLRNDSSLPSAARAAVSRTEWSPVWIPLGRDTLLEQQLLADIRDRLAAGPLSPRVVINPGP